MTSSAARKMRTLKVAGLVIVVVAMAAAAFVIGQTADQEPPVSPTYPAVVGAAVVWAVDDAHRIEARRGRLPAMSGQDNAIWQPNEPVRLFGLREETLAVQIVVSAGDRSESEVTVQLHDLYREGERASGIFVERFVVHELHMQRRSGGRDPMRSLGWSNSVVPPGPAGGARIADALIPIEHAQPWADYPMEVSAGSHRVVWVDITLAANVVSGSYRGRFEVRHGTDASMLAELPVELTVGSARLPFRAVKTMVFFEPDDVAERIGSREAVSHFQELMHRHHLSTVFPVRGPDDIRAQRAALDGSQFDPQNGYRGPGAGVGADVVVIGAYGQLGPPNGRSLKNVAATLDLLAQYGIGDDPGRRDVFLYAVDEQCDSRRGPDWRRALDGSTNERLRRLRVGHTCSRPPADQPVDLVMVAAGFYRPSLAAAARAQGKHVWIYNGELPRTGSFLTDSWPVSLRANAWIQAHFGIERWFYWESAFWNDGNRGGKGPYDPLKRAETFHNADGDYCNGDGVLVYPGQQSQGWRDLGFPGVTPSIRLKQWRRGVQDAGYIALAREVDARATERIVSALVGEAFVAVDTPRWPTQATPWTLARRQLFELIVSR